MGNSRGVLRVCCKCASENGETEAGQNFNLGL